jgi:hypothetical protein
VGVVVIVDVVLGATIRGLMPPLLISVAFNGMALPLCVGSLPGVASGDAVPLSEGWEVVAVQPVKPPPSKVPFVVVVEVVAQVVSGIGLSPPGLISVAPSGMPDVAGAVVAPRTPRGDVAPIAGELPGTCARAAPESDRIAANIGRMRRMRPLQVRFSSL